MEEGGVVALAICPWGVTVGLVITLGGVMEQHMIWAEVCHLIKSFLCLEGPIGKEILLIFIVWDLVVQANSISCCSLSVTDMLSKNTWNSHLFFFSSSEMNQTFLLSLHCWPSSSTSHNKMMQLAKKTPSNVTMTTRLTSSGSRSQSSFSHIKKKNGENVWPTPLHKYCFKEIIVVEILIHWDKGTLWKCCHRVL